MRAAVTVLLEPLDQLVEVDFTELRLGHPDGKARISSLNGVPQDVEVDQVLQENGEPLALHQAVAAFAHG